MISLTIAHSHTSDQQKYPDASLAEQAMQESVEVPVREHFIGGVWMQPRLGRYLDCITSIDGRKVGRIPAGTREDVQAGVASAKAAHTSGVWGRLPGSKRAHILRSIAKEVSCKKADLASLETMDCGKPIVEAEADMDEVVSTLEFYAGLAQMLEDQGDEDLKVPDPNLKIVIRREPLGVCALITPWNYPLLMAMWKIGPALAAGNTVVLKPSEVASITCLEFAEIAFRAGLPAGVLNVVTGTGSDAGAALSSSSEVAKVSFTGSVATGRRIGHAAVENLNPTTLELGGKSPLIIFADALESAEALEKAVEWTMFGIFWTVGQICSATSRVLVEDTAAPKFWARLKARTEEIIVGNPLHRDTRLGPLVSEPQFRKVLQYIQVAKRQGCKLLTGGGRHPELSSGGFYVQPTIFIDVPLHSQLWREEVFGPVLACRTFQTEEEAVRIANDTEYGLAAAVFSGDKDRTNRVVDQFESGIVWVNTNQLSHISAPWGGVKSSGYGRDCGAASLQYYLNLKQVATWVSNEKLDWFPSKL